jgi:hypothetical protein
VQGEGENDVVKLYDQELRSGKILVVAEDHSPKAEPKLAQAAAIMAESATAPAQEKYAFESGCFSLSTKGSQRDGSDFEGTGA